MIQKKKVDDCKNMKNLILFLSMRKRWVIVKTIDYYPRIAKTYGLRQKQKNYKNNKKSYKSKWKINLENYLKKRNMLKESMEEIDAEICMWKLKIKRK